MLLRVEECVRVVGEACEVVGEGEVLQAGEVGGAGKVEVGVVVGMRGVREVVGDRKVGEEGVEGVEGAVQGREVRVG